MFKKILITISILLACQLSFAQTTPQRKVISINSEAICDAEWGRLSVFYGSVTFEYDEDYWKKDYDYCIHIEFGPSQGPAVFEFPFGKLTIHEARTHGYLRFYTIDGEEQDKYFSYTPKYAMELGAEKYVKILESIFPTCYPYERSFRLQAQLFVRSSDNVYTKNGYEFGILMNK